MTENEFKQMIATVLENGIEITMSMDENKVIWFDMNTQMKSELKIAFIDDVCVYKARYQNGTIEDLRDMLYLVQEFYHYRDFGSDSWLNYLEKGL